MARLGVPFALAALAVLAVSACSSGSPGSSSARVATSPSASTAGAGSPPSAAAGTTPTAPASAPPGSVRVGLLTEEFSTPLPADPAKATVVTDFEQALVLYDKSQENFGLVSPVTSWVTGSALTDLKKTFASMTQSELVPAGVERFFQTSVALSGSSATITTCDDASKYVQENPRTHVINPSSEHLPLNQEYISITWGMTQVPGHWAIKSITVAPASSAAAKSCLP